MPARSRTSKPESSDGEPRARHNVAFSGIFALFFAAVLATSLGLPHQARLFPVTMSTLAVVLALSQLLADLRGRSPAASSRGVDLQADDELAFASAARAAAPHFLAIVLLAAGVLLLGPLLPAGAFVLAYVRYFGDRGWGFSLLLALGVMLGLVLVFYVLVSTTWPRGLFPGPQRFLLDLFSGLR